MANYLTGVFIIIHGQKIKKWFADMILLVIRNLWNKVNHLLVNFLLGQTTIQNYQRFIEWLNEATKLAICIDFLIRSWVNRFNDIP